LIFCLNVTKNFNFLLIISFNLFFCGDCFLIIELLVLFTFVRIVSICLVYFLLLEMEDFILGRLWKLFVGDFDNFDDL
jgi:hypothetical protein